MRDRRRALSNPHSRQVDQRTSYGGALCWKPVIPGCGANASVNAPRPIRARGGATQADHFNDAAAGGAGWAQKRQPLVPVGRLRLLVLEAGEDAVFLVHGL